MNYFFFKEHICRFDLRPALEHPKEWYKRVKIKWPEVIRNIKLDYMGADLQINARTIASRHDRSIYIEAKHLLPKNHNVESRPTITKSSMRHGALEHVTDYDYQEPESLEEMLTAVANLGALDHSLWPQDYTHIVVMKVAAKFKFFKEAGRDSVRVFNSFFNKIMESNAGDPTRHPRVYDEAVRLAKNVIEEWGYSSEVPAFKSAARAERTERDILNNNDRGDRSDKKANAMIGRVPRDFKLAKFGGDDVCLDFNRRGGCKKPVAPGAKGCLVASGGTKMRLHCCAIALRINKAGDPALCGHTGHNATTCSKRK